MQNQIKIKPISLVNPFWIRRNKTIFKSAGAFMMTAVAAAAASLLLFLFYDFFQLFRLLCWQGAQHKLSSISSVTFSSPAATVHIFFDHNLVPPKTFRKFSHRRMSKSSRLKSRLNSIRVSRPIPYKVRDRRGLLYVSCFYDLAVPPETRIIKRSWIVANEIISAFKWTVTSTNWIT